jgi:hypothetical protein
LDLIPNEVDWIILNPVEPFVEHTLPLFIQASELIHFKSDTVQFWVIIRVIEVHDFTIPPNSDDDVLESSDDSVGNGILGPEPSLSTSLRPWMKTYRLANDLAPLGEVWSSLPSHGGGIA